jgi:hypothetical protein
MTKDAAKTAVPSTAGALAGAEVERLNDQELKFARLYREQAEALVALLAKRGQQIRDASDHRVAAGEVSRQINALKEDLNGWADAAADARRARELAIPVVFKAEADDTERKADKLDASAVKLQAESEHLLEALQAHDDCEYGPLKPVAGANFGREVLVRRPRHERLRQDAEQLRAQARDLRKREPSRAGSVSATNLEELIDKAFAIGMRVSPTVDAIAQWAEKAVTDEKRRRARLINTADGFVAADAPLRLYMEWHDGIIDQATSGAGGKVTPFGPTPYEITREAAATGKTVEEVAEEWGVVVPAVATKEPERPVEAPAKVAPTERELLASVDSRPPERSPYDTSATADEVRQEAALTGKSVEQVAKEFGVPVPGPATGSDRSPHDAASPTPYELAREKALTGKSADNESRKG